MTLGRAEVMEACAQLEDEFRPRFADIGMDFNAWGNRKTIAAEVCWSGKRVGRMWGAQADWGRRRNWFSAVRPVRPLAEAIADVRRQLEDLLATQPWR